MFFGWKTDFILVVAFLVAGSIYTALVWRNGYDRALLDQARAAEKVTTKQVETHAQKENEIIRLADPDLDARLERWMRRD